MMAMSRVVVFCPEDAAGELTVSPCRLDVGLPPGRLLAHVDGEAGLNTPGGGGSRQKKWSFAEAAPSPPAPLLPFKSIRSFHNLQLLLCPHLITSPSFQGVEEPDSICRPADLDQILAAHPQQISTCNHSWTSIVPPAGEQRVCVRVQPCAAFTRAAGLSVLFT